MKLKKYSGYPPWTNGELQTCSAFVSALEAQFDMSNSITNNVSQWLEGPALEWWKDLEHNINEWILIKHEFIQKVQFWKVSHTQI